MYKKTIIIMAHRPAAIAECELLMILEHGKVKAFGPRDKVLRSQITNYTKFAEKL